MTADPNKPVSENYPELEFDAATRSIQSLIGAEKEVEIMLLGKFGTPIYIWEYGYYFFSLFITHSNIHKSYVPIVALVTEAHSAIRSAFLSNLKGYHADSIVLVRKIHESLIRAAALKANPKNIERIIMNSGIGKAERSIGMNLSELYHLESSFTHSNTLKSLTAWRELNEGKDDIGVSYGPQVDEKQFLTSINISIFWLYSSICLLPKLFPGQVSDHWISKQGPSLKILRDYLINIKSSMLIDGCDQVDLAASKI